MWEGSESPGQSESENRNPERTMEARGQHNCILNDLSSQNATPNKNIFQKQKKTIVFYRQKLREFKQTISKF